jgi:hypothetical protein
MFGTMPMSLEGRSSKMHFLPSLDLVRSPQLSIDRSDWRQRACRCWSRGWLPFASGRARARARSHSPSVPCSMYALIPSHVASFINWRVVVIIVVFVRSSFAIFCCGTLGTEWRGRWTTSCDTSCARSYPPSVPLRFRSSLIWCEQSTTFRPRSADLFPLPVWRYVIIFYF